MMSESVMKPGRAGVLEEMGRTRDTIFHQLNHQINGRGSMQYYDMYSMFEQVLN